MESGKRGGTETYNFLYYTYTRAWLPSYIRRPILHDNNIMFKLDQL